MGGVHGRLLVVDVGTRSVEHRPIDSGVSRRYLGGAGLGTRLLLDEARAAGDPLAADAPFVVALSPLVGTPVTTSAKFAVVAKSPLTDRIGDALSSDRFAVELKRCGIDALVLTGRSDEPVSVVVDGDRVTFEPAGGLVGLPALEAESRLRTQCGAAFRGLAIGLAGERRVRYATVSTDGRHAGRGGLGAVLGSKNVKAILARGGRPTPLHDPARVLAIAKDLSRRSLGPATAKYREMGTVANVLLLNRLGALPTRNFGAGSFAGADAVSGEAFQAESGGVRKHCASCTIGCEHIFESPDGGGVRLEYQGLFALGPLCGIEDRGTILRAAARCDALGIDVISAGGTIAFAMECTERGLLDAVAPAAEHPRFGDGASLLRTLDAIGLRSSALGTLLGEGSRRAARAIGKGSERFALHVKGMELPGYDPRALQTLALGFAVGTRGADHNKSSAYEADLSPGTERTTADVGKGLLAARSEDKAALLDSLVLCKFLRGVFDDFHAEAADMLAAVTGWDVTADELRTTAERIVTAKKLFNVAAGWTRAEDTLPAKILEEPIAGADGADVRLTRTDLDAMIGAYYAARHWSGEGAVPATELSRLGLASGG